MSRLVIILLALAAVPAHANVGKRRFEGTRMSEPTGLHDVAIPGEDLEFDLRPLDAGDNARVSVTYALYNRSAETVTAALVFISGSRVEHGVAVAFDQTSVRGEPAAQQGPPAWNGPISTPALDGDGTLAYETDRDAATAFTLAISPGAHELAVTYDAVPQRNRSSAGGTIVYQLGYVLAPARDWGAFGTLDVSLDVPAGWRVAVTPPIERLGEARLQAHFTELPADTLGITLQAPTGTLHNVLEYAMPLLALLVLAGGAAALFALGRSRRADDLRPLWPVSLPLSLVWATAIAISGGFAAIRSELALPEHQSAAYGYGGAFGILFAIVLGLVAIPVGLVIARAGSRRPTEPAG